MVSGIVLAAGASERFGAPKQLARVAGTPAVSRVAQVLRQGGCDEVVVVLGAYAAQVRAAIPPGILSVDHPEWKEGRTSTVKAGLRAVGTPDAVLVHPADHPAVDPATVRDLLAAKGEIVVPTYEGKRGHPTLFRGDALRGIAKLRDDEPLHDILHANPQRVVEVAVNDAGILLNLDTPADLARIEASLGRSARARPAP